MRAAMFFVTCSCLWVPECQWACMWPFYSTRIRGELFILFFFPFLMVKNSSKQSKSFRSSLYLTRTYTHTHTHTHTLSLSFFLSLTHLRTNTHTYTHIHTHTHTSSLTLTLNLLIKSPSPSFVTFVLTQSLRHNLHLFSCLIY